MRRLFYAFVALEGLRLLLWLTFLGWLLSVYDVSWKGGEAGLPSLLAAAYFGFPYSWLIGFLVDWDFLRVTDHVPLRIAFSHFALWALITAVIGWFLHRASK